jgi:hypothetical protein
MWVKVSYPRQDKVHIAISHDTFQKAVQFQPLRIFFFIGNSGD